jgi:hypothetical protein
VMHASDRNRLTKRQTALVLASTDMKHARAALDALENEHASVHLMRALETAIFVSYARAFTQSSLLQLNTDEFRPVDRNLAGLHDDLLQLRDKAYAHTDKDSGRSITVEMTQTTVSEDSAGTGVRRLDLTTREQWRPLNREAIPAIRRLIDEVEWAFSKEAMGIQARLDTDS